MYSSIERVTKLKPNSYKILISQEVEKGKLFCNMNAIITQANILKVMAVHQCNSLKELTNAKVNISVVNAGNRASLSFKFRLRGAFKNPCSLCNVKTPLRVQFFDVKYFAHDIIALFLQNSTDDYCYLLCGTEYEMLRQAFDADNEKSAFPKNILVEVIPNNLLECQLVIPVQRIECEYFGG